MPVNGIVGYTCEKRGVVLTSVKTPWDTVIVMWLCAVWWINTDVSWTFDSYRFMVNNGGNSVHRNVCTALSVNMNLPTYYLLHAEQPFLRRQLVLIYSRNSQHFMVREILLPSLQVPATCPYPEPFQSNQCSPTTFLKFHLSNMLSSTPGPFPQVSHQNPVRISPLPHLLHAPPI